MEDWSGKSVQELEKVLTDKQKTFVREYMVDKNGTQAAIRAGYKRGKDDHAAAVMASRLLREPKVNAYKTALQKEAFRRLGVSLESVCAELVEIKDRCMQKSPVLVWDSEKHAYVESGEWQFDAKGATKALAELADLLDLKENSKKGAGGAAIAVATEEGFEQ